MFYNMRVRTKRGMSLNKKHRVQILPFAKCATAKEGELLADVLLASDVPIGLSCGRKGICGKCLVEIVRGALPSAGEREKNLLERLNVSARVRLACLYRITGDVTVRVPEASLLGPVSVIETGIHVSVCPEPRVHKFALRLRSPALGSGPFLEAEILEQAYGKNWTYSLRTLRKLPEAGGKADGLTTVVILDDREILDIEDGDTSGECYGIALDIGTSTVVAELVNLSSGKTVCRTAAVNGQAPFGADVMSRLAFSLEEPKGLDRLGAAIRDQVNGLISGLAHDGRISTDRIYEIVIAGNTAMNHLFLGVPVTSLATSPFRGVFSVGPEIRAKDIGLGIHPEAPVFIVPNIRSFVGGDIAAGLAATGLEGRNGTILFIDLGTNGEIVLKHGRRMTTTSTAAGPAFEGMTLSCGMPAFPGAVCSASWKAGGFDVRTIGNRPARGICGSGLVDLLALALKKGFLLPDGRIAGTAGRIRIGRSLSLTQADVRKIQLSLAAIKAGTGAMLDDAGIGISDLDEIIVAGAFGSRLDAGNASAIGLLPSIPAAKVLFVGNASLAGARRLLLSGPEQKTIGRRVRTIRHLQLASIPGFQDRFVRALEIKPEKGETR
jgi:uncharacterized 2Fe-2S/4Fe-4S cluster protein (DUF4445 family)